LDNHPDAPAGQVKNGDQADTEMFVKLTGSLNPRRNSVEYRRYDSQNKTAIKTCYNKFCDQYKNAKSVANDAG
jgi:hypothetical protein